jgi:methyl-accepting chemotaxis protein
MTNPPGGVERRKRLLVNSAVQGRYVGLIALAVVAAVALFAVGVAIEGDQTLPALVVRLLVALSLFLAGVVYIGLIFSRRLVGPIYAFARTLAQITRGEYTGALRLRKHDQFTELAEAFNRTLEALRTRAAEDVMLLDELATRIGQAPGLDDEAKRALLARLESAKAAKQRHLTPPSKG